MYKCINFDLVVRQTKNFETSGIEDIRKELMHFNFFTCLRYIQAI